MRLDSLGLWWQDVPNIREGRGGGRRERPMPMIPETGWNAPSEFPNLSAAKVIGFDTETYDPELLTSGAGWARNSGHIIGASLAVEDGTSWYFPMRHETAPEGNLDPEQVKRFLDYTLQDNRPKVGANLIYDLGWCRQEGIRVGGRLYDIQFAEALLNSEAPDVSLESLSQNYLGVGKETSILYDWLARWKGGPADHHQRKHLYLAPPSLVGPYAQADASLPIRILNAQWKDMASKSLLDLFDLECRLIPLLVAMRFKGARVDLEAAEQYHAKLDRLAGEAELAMREIAGQPVNPGARDSIKSAFQKIGLALPKKVDKKTGLEKETTEAAALEQVDHPLAKAILDYRRLVKVRDVFIKSYILDKHVKGRIHCSFHPLRNDESGTRSGRFSSSDPNLQNIPVRTDIGREVRRVFVAASGGRWRKFDYSQIEYRMLAHYAVGEGAEELIRAYNERPDVDYHELTGELVLRLTGIELPRRNIKNINFGLIYGMAEPRLASSLGLDRAQGKQLFQDYHRAAPFARATMNQAANEVHRLGYVTTLLGRRSEFPFWGPKRWEDRTAIPDYREACRRWGSLNIERAFTHKALNRRLQGSAADIMKYAMVTAYEAGFFEDDACGMPGLTVHDELDFEDYGDPQAPVWDAFKQHMETAMPGLRVPVKIDMKVGPNWGDAD